MPWLEPGSHPWTADWLLLITWTPHGPPTSCSHRATADEQTHGIVMVKLPMDLQRTKESSDGCQRSQQLHKSSPISGVGEGIYHVSWPTSSTSQREPANAHRQQGGGVH